MDVEGGNEGAYTRRITKIIESKGFSFGNLTETLFYIMMILLFYQ